MMSVTPRFGNMGRSNSFGNMGRSQYSGYSTFGRSFDPQSRILDATLLPVASAIPGGMMFNLGYVNRHYGSLD